jgi:hypothetical protein
VCALCPLMVGQAINEGEDPEITLVINASNKRGQKKWEAIGEDGV